MVEEFAGRFPDSQLLSYVYYQAAKAYQQKGDLNRLVEYAEKSLKLDPNNILSMLLLAIVLPQPRMLQAGPEVASQRLSAADSYANRALKVIAALPKSDTETEEQFQNRKASLASDAHTALAMVCMNRDDTGKAIEEFNTAISLAVKPNPQLYFRLGEVYANVGKKAEAIEAFSKASELGRGTAVQKYAQDRIQELSIR
jgi:tetratricopeptide (TPR) repeat protein